MPPEASSFPDSGSNFTETSRSIMGPSGATITLNSLVVARWTRAFVPTGTPGISSTSQRPLTVVHPSRPFVSKSGFCSAISVGSLISGTAEAAGRGADQETPSAATASPNTLRRGMQEPSIASSPAAFLWRGLPRSDQRSVGYAVTGLHHGDIKPVGSAIALCPIPAFGLVCGLPLPFAAPPSVRHREQALSPW